MIENRDQYKDLEYYPDRVCKCGCDGRISVKYSHNCDGIPEYLPGHHRRKKFTSETAKRIEEWNKYKDLEYYPDRFCGCSCGDRIKVRSNHKYRGIPNYIRGHNPSSKRQKQRARETHLGKPSGMLHKHHSEESKEKIRKFQKDNHRPMDGKNHPNWQGGMIEITCLYCGEKKEVHRYRKDIAKYCSVNCDAAALKIKYAGEGNPNWQGGVSKLPYPFEFNNELKESIRERDDYTCQLCGKIKEELDRNISVHHIDYDKDNLDLNNLISLCNTCNTKVNFNREYWTSFFSSKLKN